MAEISRKVKQSAGKRLGGYVLLESIVAMIVIMLCFGIATAIVNNVVSGSRSSMRLLARLRLEQEAQRSKNEKRFIDETIAYPEFHIEKKIHPREESAQLFELEIRAVAPDGKTLDEYHALFRQY